MVGNSPNHDSLALSRPAKRVSAWVAETDPKATVEWLNSLPMADSAEAGRELSQALYTLNRMELEPAARAELLELYGAPVTTVVNGLQQHLAQFSLPLSPKRRQLAEFICRLYVEMAAGYKCCLMDLLESKIGWGKKQLHMLAAARALQYLAEVLLRSYLAYMPHPPTVWREIHELYRYAEAHDRQEEPVEAPPGVNEPGAVSIGQSYRRALLLGLCNPYQLTRTESIQIARFLEKWGGKARLLRELNVRNAAAQFLVDFTVDSPPIPYPRKVHLEANPGLRILDALALVRTVHGFVNELQNGKPAASLDLGFDCLEVACLDVLRRMMRAWGLVARRRHSRIRRRGHVSLCAGINAVHFFSDGQTPFAPPGGSAPPSAADTGADITQPLRESTGPAEDDQKPPAHGQGPAEEGGAMPASAPVDLYRIDRWQIRDISPRGMFLARSGEALAHVRVGEVLGIQRVDELGHWNVATVRWMRSPRADTVEMGIELLAPHVTPVAVRALGRGAHFTQGLLLPAIEALRRPATLLLPRGMYRSGSDYELIAGSMPARRVRALKLVERANTFERVVFADVAH